MNILFINHYAGTPHYGMEFRPYYLAREWVRLGHAVTIVGASYSHLRSCQPEVRDALAEEDVEGIRYVWLKTPAYSGNGLKRLWNIVVFVLRLWWHRKRVVGDFPPAAVIASSPHPLVIFPARRIAAKYNSKLFFEVRDLWPLSLIQLNDMSRWNPLVMFLQFVENYAHRRSDYVVSLLSNAYSYMSEHGLTKNKYVFVPNGIHAAGWEELGAPLPPRHAECIESLRRQGRCIVGYIGGHQPSNALRTVLDAAQLLRGSSVALVLIGQGSKKAELQQRAEQEKIENVFFLPPILRECIPAALAAMDIGYVGLKDCPLFHYGISPNKLMDYMMAAKPIILAVDAENNVVTKSNCGIACHGEDAPGVRDAILHLSQLSRAELAAMGQRGKEFVLRHRQFSHLAQRFLDVMQHASGNTATPTSSDSPALL
jgi:hypothetical protein